MVKYFERIPAAAIRPEIDGNRYAYVSHTVGADGVRPCDARMVRANGALVYAGEAYIYIGQMGSAIAQRVNLPFAISADAPDIAPTHLLPRYTTPIDRPGQYLTRKGELVRMVSGCAGLWSGWILRTATNGATHKQWSEWSDNGLFGDAPEFDIVAYVGE